MTDFTNDLIFLDFEASSLASNSWPVEVGLSWLADDGALESHARLIRPHPTWSMDAWSEDSAAVHAIPYATLEKGLDASDAVEWYQATTRGRRICSDAPKYDTMWLRRLLETSLDPLTVDHELARVRDIRVILEPMLPLQALDAYYDRLARLWTPHRAGPDSARYASALRVAFLAR
ncbi:MAG: hypothetical protein ACU0E9_12055 [Limimaricola soesokkakensis]|uniref:hypothetical protein n=1 Tax=Limimaricola soesokkakensis TaxID=1343159 RepID=UPI0040581DDD